MAKESEKDSIRIRMNANSVHNSDDAFSAGGSWEKHGGPEQTRRFARAFIAKTKRRMGDFASVLDFGCALGDAAPIFRADYPKLIYYGCDFSRVAIERCRSNYSAMGTYFVSSWDELDSFWDVIYCSNVLEHFDNYIEVAHELLTHCSTLCIMTPFIEQRAGQDLKPDGVSFHVATLRRNSFDELSATLNCHVQTLTLRVYGAWGGGWISEAASFMRRLLRGRFEMPPRQIIYICSR